MTTQKHFFDLSVVIPAHNEAQRLPRTLHSLGQFAESTGWRIEAVIADDRSTDDTLQVAWNVVQHLPLTLQTLKTTSGVAWAVRTGMLASRGRRLLYSDADGAVPFEDVLPLWRALNGGAHVAVGSRRLGAARIEVPQPWHRVIMGKIWSGLARSVLPTGVSDTQCGFKLFTRAAAHAVFAPLRSRSFVFHVEALARARQLGLEVVELPVRWRDVEGSKIKLARDPAAMALELCALSLNLGRRLPLPLGD